MVDEVRPGDRVEITGIYKAMGVRVNPQKRTLKNIYRTYIDVVTYLKTDKGRVDRKDQDDVDNEQKGDKDMENNFAVGEQALNQDH